MKPNPIPERERERPQTFFPRTPDEITFAKMRAAMVDLQARIESLEDKQFLALGSASTFLLDSEPGAAERANGRDRPAEPETETDSERKD